MTPEELIAEQDATITELRADIERLETRLIDMAPDGPDYYEGVYDRIRAAWDAWAFAELGTVSPSHADLVGRPELAHLWESVR